MIVIRLYRDDRQRKLNQFEWYETEIVRKSYNDTAYYPFQITEVFNKLAENYVLNTVPNFTPTNNVGLYGCQYSLSSVNSNIPNTFSPNEFTSDKPKRSAYYEVRDVNGNLYQSSAVEVSDNKFVIRVDPLPRGYYTIKVSITQDNIHISKSIALVST